jgi:hypothetical protein
VSEFEIGAVQRFRLLTFMRHDTATCYDCGSSLVYGTKEEATGWKVYYECNDRCGCERMAG